MHSAEGNLPAPGVIRDGGAFVSKWLALRFACLWLNGRRTPVGRPFIYPDNSFGALEQVPLL